MYRIFENGLIKRDLIDLENEDKPVNSLPLLEKIFDKGEILLKMPSIKEIQRFHLHQIKTLPPKFLDLDFISESFPVSNSRQLEDRNIEFEPQ